LRGAREPPRRRRGGLDRGYDPVAVTSEEEFFKLPRGRDTEGAGADAKVRGIELN
jgi:hypothetical protein